MISAGLAPQRRSVPVEDPDPATKALIGKRVAVVGAGSMFSMRVVRADSEGSAARPTEVTRLAPGVVEVFSGKLVNCTEAARAVVAEVVKASG